MAPYSVRLRPGIQPDEGISPQIFGAIQTGFQHFAGFSASVDTLGVTHVRWPGGTLAEQRTEVYGLEIDGLFDATNLYAYDPLRNRPDLGQMMEFAREREMPLTVIIPTARYAGNLPHGLEELEAFLAELLSEAHGPLPERLILQIGNEYAFQPEFSGNAALFGNIANAFIESIQRAIDSESPAPGRVEIAMQMGVTHSDNSKIISEISSESIRAIDALTFHHLPISLRNLHRTEITGDPEDIGRTRFERHAEYYRSWLDVLRGIDDTASQPHLYLSAWTVGSSSLESAYQNTEFNDFGLPAASTALDLIYNYTRIGVDMAAVWGVDVINPNRLSLATQGQLEISPYGLLFRMMAEEIVGATPLPGAEGFSRDDFGNVYAFQSPSSITIYATVNNISEHGASLLLDLQGVDPSWAMASRIIEATPSKWSDDRLNQAGNEGVDFATLRDISPTWTEGRLEVYFSQDYSVAEIKISIPSTARWGTEEGDSIIGTSGDDFIFGYEGNDFLNGGAGDDHLRGGDGDDTMVGGSGANTLYGGTGGDQFVFLLDEGRHTIRDFDIGFDLLDVSRLISDSDIQVEKFGQMVASLMEEAADEGALSISFSNAAEGTEIRFLTSDVKVSLLLEGLQPGDLTVDDFVFL